MKNKNLEKQDFGKVVLQDITGGDPKAKKNKRSFWHSIQIPFLAILTGLIIGAILIAVTSETVYAAFAAGFFKGLGQAFKEIGTAYLALFTGSLGNPVNIINALKGGEPTAIRSAF